MNNAIIEAINNAKKHNVKIPLSHIEKWSGSLDVDVMGAVFYILTDENCYANITPSPKIESYNDFFLRYFEYCILNDPDSNWADSRYTACYNVTKWFKYLWRNNKKNQLALKKIKTWLENICKQGDSNIQKSIEYGILEHLLDRNDVLNFFSNWKTDKSLKLVLDESLKYSKKKT